MDREHIEAMTRAEFEARDRRIIELTDALSKASEDASWLLSELGHEHWQNCDLTNDDCYLCAGYLSIREQYKNA